MAESWRYDGETIAADVKHFASIDSSFQIRRLSGFVSLATIDFLALTLIVVKGCSVWLDGNYET